MDELFAKALQRLVNCLLVSNSLRGNLVSLLELLIIFDDNLKVVLVYFLFLTFLY